MNTNMQQGEILRIFLSESKLPAITGTSPTLSGRQLIKTAILFIDGNSWHINKQTTILLDITGFIRVKQ